MFRPPFLKKVSLPAAQGEGFPFNLPLFRNGLELEITNPVTIIVGENGSGKSTLLEAIATQAGFSNEGGSPNTVFGEVPQPMRQLADAMTLSWLPRMRFGFFLRAESFFNFASELDEIRKGPLAGNTYFPYGGKSLHEQSHGESFMALFQNRVKNPGIYIFDEPEAALSPMRQLALLGIIRSLQREGKVQIIMATHSPILMACPNTQLMLLENGTLRQTEWKQTPHAQLYQRFMAAPERYIAAMDEET